MHSGAAQSGRRRRIKSRGFIAHRQRARPIDWSSESVDHAPLPALIWKDLQGAGPIDSLTKARKGPGVKGLDRCPFSIEAHDFGELSRAAGRERDAFAKLQEAGQARDAGISGRHFAYRAGDADKS